ncbi:MULTISPECIES: tRNA (guanosine(46)-N7)-methyltransferase TrmB [unclassified Spiroplasma]|uniref:tRNA (guanosine(46)-N7)-methyltransferase TrmB n=1 Tax=unclassified Spiroplasma TaxID=2637901 RepID=UPI0030CCBE58
MRVRNKPWAKEFILTHNNLCINDPYNYKGKWNKKIFQNKNPINIEIGSGKGNFIINLAKQNSNQNYIAIEKNISIVTILLKKLIENKLCNLKIIIEDAINLKDFFANNEINKIYLNFSDPWPKKRHFKRRLTYQKFLEIYKKILIKNGQLHFKTDNNNLFNYSLLEFEKNKWNLLEYTINLHQDNNIIKNDEAFIKTEYEEKFIKQNKNINYLLIQKNKIEV